MFGREKCLSDTGTSGLKVNWEKEVLFTVLFLNGMENEHFSNR